MNPLCNLQNMFGPPGTGIHSIRLFDVAIIDVIMTLIFAIIFAKITKLNIVMVIIILFLLSIVMHRIFCVRTTVDKMLFSK